MGSKPLTGKLCVSYTTQIDRIMIFLFGWKEKRNTVVPYPKDYIGIAGDTSHIMDSRVSAGTWVHKDMSVVLRHSWSWLAKVLDIYFHNLTLYQFLLTVLQICWQTKLPRSLSTPALGWGIRFHFLPHALWNFFLVFRIRQSTLISTVCDCISYCI